MKIHVNSCAACGEDHRDVCFEESDKDPVWPYKGECPKTGKRIEMRLTPIKTIDMTQDKDT